MGKADTDRDISQHQGDDRRVSKDWIPFAHNLEQVLSLLEEDQFLILLSKHGNRSLQFSFQGAWGIRAEVSSNHFLKGGDRLTRVEMAWLATHGWSAPTGTPKQAVPDRDPDGSPNHFIDFPTSVSASHIVSVAINTLTHGLAFSYPGALCYRSFDSTGGELEFIDLGLKRALPQDEPLMEQVVSVLRSVTGIEDLVFDDDEELRVCYGAIVISVFPVANRLRLFSVLVTEVAETPTLLRKLNQINDGDHRIRLFCNDDAVFATLDLPSDPFVPAHLVSAMGEFAEMAESLAIVLSAEFLGKTVIEPSGPVSCLQ